MHCLSIYDVLYTLVTVGRKLTHRDQKGARIIFHHLPCLEHQGATLSVCAPVYFLI